MSIKSRIKKFWGNTTRDKRLTPKPELDLYFGIAPGIQYPEISPSLPLIKYVHDNSPSIKIATMRLRESIFRRGFEWEPNYIVKCRNCEKEYDYEINTCDNCGDTVSKPDESEVTIGTNFFKNCSIKSDYDGKTILAILKQIEDDINLYDDAYLIGIKEYWQDEDGNIVYESLHEIVRGDPIMMRIVANEYAEMGGKWCTCLRHRDQILEIPMDQKAHNLNCPMCGRYMYDIHYVNARGEAPEAYYIGNEVIHISKYAPSQLYGFSPIVTLWQYTLTLTNMAEYIYRSYTEQHLPKGVLAIKTSNPDSAFEFWRDVDDKLRKDPHYIPKMFIEGEGQGSGSGMEFVKFMDTLEEMQYTPIRDEIRRTIAAMYGVTNIFMGDMGGVGGLNAESEQIQITNMSAESAMVIYNDTIIPKLMKWLNIQDWQYKLNSPFEEDNSIKLNEDIMKSQIAQSMLMMGFDVELDTTSKGLEFKYSGKAQKPEMGGFDNEMMMGLDKELPHCPQGYHRVDGVCKPTPLVEQLPGGLHEQVHAKYPSRFEADKPLHEQVGTKFPSRPKKPKKKQEKGKKVYIKDPSKAPKGVKVERGSRGGYYYEKIPIETRPKVDDKDKYLWSKDKNINFIRNIIPEDIKSYGAFNEDELIDEISIDSAMNKSLKRISPYIKDINIYRLPKFERGTNGFTLTKKQHLKDIFIPRYSKSIFEELNDDPKGVKKLADKFASTYPRSKSMNGWRSKVQDANVVDSIEKTILHERAHLTVFNLLYDMNNDEKDIEYQTYPDTFLDMFKEYLDIDEVASQIYGYTNNLDPDLKNKQRMSRMLGEYIAEDMRLMYLNTRQSKIFPHAYLYQNDLLTIDQDIERNTKMKRQAILLNILRRNGVNTKHLLEGE